MYTIEKTSYGLRVTMGGQYATEEIKKYLAEKEALLSHFEDPYSILVDLRTAIPPEHGDENLLSESHAKMKHHLLLRQAIIVTSPVIRMQARQIIFSAKVDDCTRIINATSTPNWESLALDWLINGTDPEATNTRSQQGVDPSKYISSFSRKS